MAQPTYTLPAALIGMLTLTACNSNDPSLDSAATQSDTETPNSEESSTETPDTTQLCTPSRSPTLPGDVPFGASGEDFDCFSWQTFAAISRPSDGAGHPDPSRPLAEGPDAHTRVVWDDWSNTADLASADNPQWREAYVPEVCAEFEGQYDVMLMQPGANDEVAPATASNMILALLRLPVSDARGNAIRFEVTLNQETFEWANERGLGTIDGQAGFGEVELPCSSLDDPGGAMTVKTTWMVLDEQQAASGRYYTREAAIYISPGMNSVAGDPSSTKPADAACELHTVGLVGMNIGRKTVQQPRWIWSNFEHVDNAPDCAPGGEEACGPAGAWADVVEQNPNSPFTKLNANDCPKSIDRDYNFLAADAPLGGSCDCNIPPVSNVEGEDPDSVLYYVDQASALEPARVCRALPIPAATQALNEAWHAELGASVWSNYVLVGTQWYAWDDAPKLGCETPYAELSAEPGAIAGAGELPDGDEDVLPQILANISMETWSQNSSSCIDCHAGAFLRGETEGVGPYADFSWWLNAAINR